MSHEYSPMLSSDQQYRFELKQLPRLNEAELVDRARQGDEQARIQLIENLMHVVEYYAFRYANAYLRHDDYLDLVQIGNLALVEYMDRALEKDVPGAYLFTCAKYTMVHYCRYHSKLIRLPENTVYLQMDIQQPVSLERILENEEDDRGEMWMGHDPLADLLDELEPEERPAFDTLYGELHAALQTLTEQQHEVVTRHYGLDEYGPEPLQDIERRINPGKKNSIAYNRHKRAIERLRRYFKRA